MYGGDYFGPECVNGKANLETNGQKVRYLSKWNLQRPEWLVQERAKTHA